MPTFKDDPNLLSDKMQFDNMYEYQKRLKTKFRFETILKLYIVLGLLCAFFGVLYFVLTYLKIHFSSRQLMSLTIHPLHNNNTLHQMALYP